MKVLELFSGTGSIGKAAEKLGYDVYSVDISDKYSNPTWKGDILNWNYKQFPPDQFDIIWASPPCCTFSSMNAIRMNKKERIANEIKNGLPFLIRTRKIIDYYQPKYWAIENPYNSRMKHYINDLPWVRVCYCMYGYLYKKPTRIWTNIPFNPKYCIPSNGCANSKKHLKSIGTTRTSNKKKKYEKYIIDKNRIIKTNEKGRRYSIPEPLCLDILKACQTTKN